MDDLQVSEAEYRKLNYLKGAVTAADLMQKRFHEDRYELLLSEGSGIERRIDWRRVANECAPEVLVVTWHDGTRSEEKFHEFPQYALIPRLGTFVCLQDDVAWSIEEGSLVARDQVSRALKLLRLRVASIDASKQDNARKLLSGLHKLLLD